MKMLCGIAVMTDTKVSGVGFQVDWPFPTPDTLNRNSERISCSLLHGASILIPYEY